MGATECTVWPPSAVFRNTPRSSVSNISKRLRRFRFCFATYFYFSWPIIKLCIQLGMIQEVYFITTIVLILKWIFFIFKWFILNYILNIKYYLFRLWWLLRWILILASFTILNQNRLLFFCMSFLSEFLHIGCWYAVAAHTWNIKMLRGKNAGLNLQSHSHLFFSQPDFPTKAPPQKTRTIEVMVGLCLREFRDQKGNNPLK